ncbi:MAG: hypothetical protein FWG33_03410 [Oscillospiraceae bacterium]|nr:hypothetical protein [Oscillospiraceae bacterium]
MDKNKTKVKYLKIKMPFKLKGGESSKVAAVLFPLLGLAVLVLGGYLLVGYLNEAGKVPDDEYIAAEKLIEEEALIGLTYEECGKMLKALFLPSYPISKKESEESSVWIFPAGSKAYIAGNGQIFYNLHVKHKNGKAVGAVFKKAKGFKEQD